MMFRTTSGHISSHLEKFTLVKIPTHTLAVMAVTHRSREREREWRESKAKQKWRLCGRSYVFLFVTILPCMPYAYRVVLRLLLLQQCWVVGLHKPQNFTKSETSLLFSFLFSPAIPFSFSIHFGSSLSP